ncbi:MAG: hypothetical protein J7M38_00225 [Armatimonadetes bacterium]|nr:hypothetical protein [Armatimonadota bacterium]
MRVRILNMLVNNWPTKLLAAAISIALWAYVLGAQNPQDTRTLTLPVVGENIPEGLAVISITPEQAEVRMRGRTMRFEQTDFDRMRLRADLRGAQVGEQSVPLSVTGLPLGLQVLPGYPTTARVRLDKIISRKRPVQVVTLGEPSGDFAVENIKVEPEEITVIGATSIVARVARVVVVVDISGLNSDLESLAELEARDLRDVVVSGLNFEPPQVKVQVKVRLLNTRTVPIRPIIGNPARGYQISWVRVKPPVVTLTGAGDTLARVESVSTSHVDISGLRSRKTYTVALNVPEGVSVVGAASVNVTVSVRAQGGGRTEPEPEPSPPAASDTTAGGSEAEGTEAPPSATEPTAGGEVEPPADGGETPAEPADDGGEPSVSQPGQPQDSGDSN